MMATKPYWRCSRIGLFFSPPPPTCFDAVELKVTKSFRKGCCYFSRRFAPLQQERGDTQYRGSVLSLRKRDRQEQSNLLWPTKMKYLRFPGRTHPQWEEGMRIWHRMIGQNWGKTPHNFKTMCLCVLRGNTLEAERHFKRNKIKFWLPGNTKSQKVFLRPSNYSWVFSILKNLPSNKEKNIMSVEFLFCSWC